MFSVVYVGEGRSTNLIKKCCHLNPISPDGGQDLLHVVAADVEREQVATCSNTDLLCGSSKGGKAENFKKCKVYFLIKW